VVDDSASAGRRGAWYSTVAVPVSRRALWTPCGRFGGASEGCTNSRLPRVPSRGKREGRLERRGDASFHSKSSAQPENFTSGGG